MGLPDPAAAPPQVAGAPPQDDIPPPAPFVDPAVDPQEYVDRYNAEESFREWFDTSYPEYGSIYHAVGLPDPSAMQEEPMPEIQYGICGQGTRLIEGVCTIVVG